MDCFILSDMIDRDLDEDYYDCVNYLLRALYKLSISPEEVFF